MAGVTKGGDYKPIKPVAFQPNTTVMDAPRRKRSPKLILPLSVLALATIALFVLFSLRLVYLDIEPAHFEIKADHWFSARVGERLFVPSGDHVLTITAEGYQTSVQDYHVSDEVDSRQLSLRLAKQPGRIAITSDPTDAQVRLGTEVLGNTPLEALIKAGTQQLLITKEPLYLPSEITLEVVGLNQEQSVAVMLEPNFGEIGLRTTPEGAIVWIDDSQQGAAPGNFPIGAGLRLIRISHPDYQDHLQQVTIAAGEQLSLPLIELKPKPVIITLSSAPDGANVLAGGSWLGVTPLKIPMVVNEDYELLLQKAGYESVAGTFSLADTKQDGLHFELNALEGEIDVTVSPPDAEIFVNGISVGKGSRALRLPSTLHEIKVTRDGYADYLATVLPEHNTKQSLPVTMLTEAQMRRHNLAKHYTNKQRQSFQLVQPGLVKMGGGRGEPGYQFDQQRRDVRLPAPFYIGMHEVTNRQFQAFKPEHNSGVVGRLNLNAPSHPVVKVTWLDAVRYCNWLSKRENLQPVYEITNKKVSWLRNANGYRLPTESEWAWVARQPGGNEPSIYPWGNKKYANPREPLGNFAESVRDAPVPRDLPISYKDGYRGTAPVGQFKANPLGVFDLAGNVSEWTYDGFSAAPDNSYFITVADTAEKVIRGSSWQHGFVRELRLAYRRRGLESEQDVGFRLARTP